MSGSVPRRFDRGHTVSQVVLCRLDIPVVGPAEILEEIGIVRRLTRRGQLLFMHMNLRMLHIAQATTVIKMQVPDKHHVDIPGL